MIEMRLKYTDIDRGEPHHAVLTQNGSYAVLQYREGAVQINDMFSDSIYSTPSEWQDVEITND